MRARASTRGMAIALCGALWLGSLARAEPLATSTSRGLATAIASCDGATPEASESYARFRKRAKRTQCLKPWTVLVYMAADNDLAHYALWDLHEMEAGYESGRIAGASTRRADLVVQLAYPEQKQARRIHVFQQPGAYDRKLELEQFENRTPDDIRSPMVEQVAREHKGKPLSAAQEFEQFLEWGVREYPAEHTMVVVWGHGQGWAPTPPADFAGRRFGGIAFSSSNKTFLDIPSLHQALRSVSQKALGGRPFDIYASDACLMQMAEVATEVSDSARFIVGSSEVENYLGLPYRRMMFEINTGRFASERFNIGVSERNSTLDEPYLLARLLPRLFKASLAANGLHGRAMPEALRTVTMSAIASDELRGELLPALSELGRALGTYLSRHPEHAPAIAQAMRAAPSFMGGSQDLGGFVTVLKQRLSELELEPSAAQDTQPAKSASQRVLLAIDRTVISHVLGTRFEDAESQLFLLKLRALAIWLPTTKRDLASRFADFSSSIFYRELGEDWSFWLKKALGD